MVKECILELRFVTIAAYYLLSFGLLNSKESLIFQLDLINISNLPIRNLYTKLIRFYIRKKYIIYTENLYHIIIIITYKKKSISYKK